MKVTGARPSARLVQGRRTASLSTARRPLVIGRGGATSAAAGQAQAQPQAAAAAAAAAPYPSSTSSLRRRPPSVAASATGGGRRTSTSASKAAGPSDYDEQQQRLAAEIERELEQRGLTDDQLAAALRERGVPVRGGRDNRLRRLARALAEEQQQGGAAAAPSATADAAVEAAAAAAAAAAAPTSSTPSSTTDPTRRAYLVADRQQRLVDELLEVPRAELRALLAASGQEAAEDEPLSRLAQRAAWLLAEEEVAMMEAKQQQQQGQRGGTGADGKTSAASAAAAAAATSAADAVAAASSPAEVLAIVQSQDVRMMRVADLRACLRALGFSDEGGRYELRDRLATLLAVHEAARRGDRADLRRRLQSMTLRELVNELRRRGLDGTEGGKAQLTDRLAAALAASGGLVEMPADQEQFGGGGLAALARVRGGAVGGALAAADPVAAAALAAAEAAQRAPLDPAGTVALVVVAPGLLPAAGEAAAPLALAEALASARALVAALHTAPFSAAVEGVDKVAASDASAIAAAGEAAAQGLRVDVYLAATSASSSSSSSPSSPPRLFRVPAPLLSALSDADLALMLLQASEDGVESFGTDASKLAAAARHAGTAAALTVLPTNPGAAARTAAAAVAGALGVAGVPVLGGDASSAAPTPRVQTLERLLELGYPVQPVRAIDAATLEAAEKEAAALAAAREKEGADKAETANTTISESQARIAEDLTAWCDAHGYDPETQLLLVTADDGGSGFAGGVAASAPGGARFAAGVARAAAVAVEVWSRAGRSHGCAGVLVEPHPHVRDGWTAWEVTVLPALAASSSSAPTAVALPAAELELYDTDALYLGHELDLAEWRLMRDGAGPDAVAKGAARLEAQGEPDPAFAGAALAPPGLAPAREHRVLKVHCPPRASRRVAHALRHAATKAALELGLIGGGGGGGKNEAAPPSAAVRVRGWMRVDPSWAEPDVAAAQRDPDHLPTLPDPLQPDILREAQEEQERADAGRALGGLGGYYRSSDPPAASAAQLLASSSSSSSSSAADPLSPLREADLSRFDPSLRLTSRGNGGEADVCVAAIETLSPGSALPEHRGSVPAAQAAEAGLLPGALARHLLNVALAHAKAKAKGAPPPLTRLPPPPATDRSEAAQWASLTGANADAAAVRAAFEAADEREAALAEAGPEAGAELLGGEMFYGVQEGRVGLGPEAGLGENAFGVATRVVAWSADTPRIYSGDMTPEELGIGGAEGARGSGGGGGGDGGASSSSSSSAPLPPSEKEALLAETYTWLAGPAAAAQLFSGPSSSSATDPARLLRAGHPAGVLAAAEAAALAAGKDGVAAAPGQSDGAAALRSAGPLPPIPADLPTQEEKEAERARLAGGRDSDARAALRAGVALDRYPGEPLGAWAAEASALADASAAAAAGSARPFLAHEVKFDLGDGDNDGDDTYEGWLLGPSAEQEAAEAAATARKRAAALARLAARRRRVWVLVGGAGADRQAALSAGLAQAARLARHRDLQVDVFLLPPSAGAASAPAEAGEARRRAALLARRTEWLSIGVPESEMPASMRHAGLVEMSAVGGGGGSSEASSNGNGSGAAHASTPEPPPAHRLVLALSPSAAARATVEEAAEASERARERGGGTPLHGMRPPARHQREALADAQVELSLAGVAGVAGAWGADRSSPAHRAPLPPLAPYLEGEPGADGEEDADEARGLHPDSYLARRARERAYARRFGRALPAALSAAPPPRCWDVDAWLAEARDCGAVVVLSLGNDEPLGAGPLQRLMDAAGVPYAGPGPLGAERCSSRPALNAALLQHQQQQPEGGASASGEASASPQRVLPTRTLLRAAAHEADARRLLDALRAELPPGVASLCLRPRLASGGGVGVVRIATAGDLRALGSALARRAPTLLAAALSLPQPQASSPLSAAGPLGGAAPAAGGAAVVPLPPGLPDAFVVEPWVETDPVEVAVEGGKVRWAGKHRWVEVVIGVVNVAGADEDGADAAPHALPPVLIATTAADRRRAHLCPPPATVLSPAAAEAAQRAAVKAAAAVAGESGASSGAPPPGLTQVDAFCHADTGDLLVLDVRARPSLVDGHPLLLAASRSGVCPDALARRVADAALAAGARAFAPRGGGARGALGSGGSGGPSYWATGGGEAGMALQEEEEQGDILAGAPSFVGGDTDAEDDGGGGAAEELAGWSL